MKVKRLLDKGFLLSVGLAAVTKDKLEKIIGELIKRGKLNEKDGRELVMKLLNKSKEERAKIRGFVRKVRKRVVRKKKNKK